MAINSSKLSEICIIGGGIAGLTAAMWMKQHELAPLTWLFEADDKLGGLCKVGHWQDDKGFGTCEYGEHIFHTEDERIKDIFLALYPDAKVYEHITEIYVEGPKGKAYVPYPINLDTIDKLYEISGWSETAFNPKEYCSKKISLANLDPSTKQLCYRYIIEPYSRKQWGHYNFDTVLEDRIRVYLDRDNRTFRDRYQYVPDKMDYGNVRKSLKGVHIRCKTPMTYRDVINDYIYCGPRNTLIINTSPIDAFYTDNLNKCILPYRTLKFKGGVDLNGTYKDRPMTVNYPDKNRAYTRVHNYGKDIVFEYPDECIRGDIPMYPIYEEGFSSEILFKTIQKNTDKQLHLEAHEDGFAQYYTDYIRKDNDTKVTILHVGRLGSYKYMNIDTTMYQVVHALDQLVEVN